MKREASSEGAALGVVPPRSPVSTAIASRFPRRARPVAFPLSRSPGSDRPRTARRLCDVRSRAPLQAPRNVLSAAPRLGRFSARDGIQLPRARDTLEFVGSAFCELDPRAYHEILDRARNEYLPGLGVFGNACTDMDGESAHLSVDQFAFARVQSSSDVESQIAYGIADSACAANRARRAVEGREEAIPSRIHLVPAVASELSPNAVVVGAQELAPALIAQLGCGRSRADDVSKQDRREHPLGFRRFPALPVRHNRKEPLALRQQPLQVAYQT